MPAITDNSGTEVARGRKFVSTGGSSTLRRLRPTPSASRSGVGRLLTRRMNHDRPHTATSRRKYCGPPPCTLLETPAQNPISETIARSLRNAEQLSFPRQTWVRRGRRGSRCRRGPMGGFVEQLPARNASTSRWRSRRTHGGRRRPGALPLPADVSDRNGKRTNGCLPPGGRGDASNALDGGGARRRALAAETSRATSTSESLVANVRGPRWTWQAQNGGSIDVARRRDAGCGHHSGPDRAVRDFVGDRCSARLSARSAVFTPEVGGAGDIVGDAGRQRSRSCRAAPRVVG